MPSEHIGPLFFLCNLEPMKESSSSLVLIQIPDGIVKLMTHSSRLMSIPPSWARNSMLEFRQERPFIAPGRYISLIPSCLTHTAKDSRPLEQGLHSL
jgi:hypothetical protein